MQTLENRMQTINTPTVPLTMMYSNLDLHAHQVWQHTFCRHGSMSIVLLCVTEAQLGQKWVLCCLMPLSRAKMSIVLPYAAEQGKNEYCVALWHWAGQKWVLCCLMALSRAKMSIVLPYAAEQGKNEYCVALCRWAGQKWVLCCLMPLSRAKMSIVLPYGTEAQSERIKIF